MIETVFLRDLAMLDARHQRKVIGHGINAAAEILWIFRPLVGFGQQHTPA